MGQTYGALLDSCSNKDICPSCCLLPVYSTSLAFLLYVWLNDEADLNQLERMAVSWEPTLPLACAGLGPNLGNHISEITSRLTQADTRQFIVFVLVVDLTIIQFTLIH